MKKTFICLLIAIIFTNCKKDKNEESTKVSGYYQGYVQVAAGGGLLNIGILHRNNGTSRLYQFLTAIGDTSQLAADSKTDGVWSQDGSNYHCMFSKTYTVTFSATVVSGNTIEGNFQQTGGALGGTFVLNKK